MLESEALIMIYFEWSSCSVGPSPTVLAIYNSGGVVLSWSVASFSHLIFNLVEHGVISQQLIIESLKKKKKLRCYQYAACWKEMMLNSPFS